MLNIIFNQTACKLNSSSVRQTDSQTDVRENRQITDLSDIHDLDGRQLSGLDMPSLWGEEEEEESGDIYNLWQDITAADRLVVSIAPTC